MVPYQIDTKKSMNLNIWKPYLTSQFYNPILHTLMILTLNHQHVQVIHTWKPKNLGGSQVIFLYLPNTSPNMYTCAQFLSNVRKFETTQPTPN